MKTRYAIYCVLMTLVALSTPISAEYNIAGDVNADGMITTADSLLALRMAAGSVAPDLKCADVNADGSVDSLDARMILTMAQKTQVRVTAPEVVSGAFEVTIDVYNVANLYSGQFDLSFDPGVVNVTAVHDGCISGRPVPVDMWRLMDAGRIRVIFNLPGLDKISGSGYVAKIDFEITGSEGDVSVLDISDGLLASVSMSQAQEIPAVWTPDEVRIGEPSPLANRVRNVNTCENFSFIQAAIDDPDTLDGHAIVVEDGVYRENVNVTKSLTIRSLNGSANCIIQSAKICEHVVMVTADCVDMGGFTVDGEMSPEAGIYLNASHCNISNNDCSNNYIGIRLDCSGNNIISSNNCSNNDGKGIYLDCSGNNIISNNDCSDNRVGIYIDSSSNNIISSNDCSNNQVGIRRSGSCNNLIYLNNFINNRDNTDSRSSANIWNSTSTINYTYEGRNYTNYIGNYWDDYTGSDLDKDGIGDSPHQISSNSDYCPLIAPFENYSVPTENLIIVNVNAPEVISGSFNATIDIHRVADLDSGQFDLSFDSSVVNVIDVDAGNISGTKVPIIDWCFIDVNTIRVTFKRPDGDGVSGSGYVARIGFAMLGPRGCVSVLDISNGKLVNTTGKEISAVWFDDEVNIPAPVTVNAPLVVTDRFNITIDVENVTNLDSGQFELFFDPGVVIVEDVEAGNVDGTDIPCIGWWFMDVNRIGVLFNIPGIKGVSGSGHVAKITFELTGSHGDSSVLNVSNGLLVNNRADKMPTIWNDGGVVIGAYTPVNRVRNINTGEDFPFIQDAIDDPDTSDGHIIEVEDGVYHEHVKVTKSLTIRSLNGSANCVIQDVGSDHAVEINADHARVSGFTVTRSAGSSASVSAGIYLDASHCNVSRNNCSNKGVGIFLNGSGNNSISGNDCLNNWRGIRIDSSDNNISNNDCSHNGAGIHLKGSGNNISGNDCSHNGAGVHIDGSSNNNISGNDCSYNGDGVRIDSSSNNRLTGNVFQGGIVIRGDSLSDYTHEIDETNTVNGKPVYYREGIESWRIPEGAGQVILVNCKDILVEDQELNNASVGIDVAFSSNITIRNNTCSNNLYGIHVTYSSNNSISNNDCPHNWDGIFLKGSDNSSIVRNNCSNNKCGIHLTCSYGNVICLNNFINNRNNIDSHTSANIWNSTSTINYTYRGNTFANHLGNYRDDYTGSDSDKDGIGDSPHQIRSDQDDYPLVMPFETYVAPGDYTTQVRVNAPEVVSGTFDVAIDVSNVVDLDYGQFDITFDPGVVNVTAVNDGCISGEPVTIDSWEFIDVNTIRVLFNHPGATGLRGSGRIATINFETTGSQGATSVLDVSNGKLTDTVADEIPAIWKDSGVTLGVHVAVNASEVVSIASGVFNATIVIGDVLCMNGGQFDLTFDPGVMNVTGVDDGNINGTTIPILDWQFMDADTIRVTFKLSGDNSASGSGYLAKIHFRVPGSQGDDGVLDISDGTLVNTTGAEMPAIWNDCEVTLGVPVTVNAPPAVSGAFEVIINIENVTDLGCGQFDLFFDSSVVNVTGVSAGNIAGTTVPIDQWAFIDAGVIRVLFNLPGPTGVSGSGQITTIGFEAKVPDGYSVLGISDGLLVDTSAYADTIPAIWISDCVTIREQNDV